ncbi:MAG: arylsulfatase [Rhodoferax sp.]|nr:arylsulfatase [Rhodoferax sp.]
MPVSQETILPPNDASFEGVINESYKESQPHWPKPAQPPKEAPNVLIVLFDDLGFGHLSCYGGPVEAPNLAALAANGLRYNNFHTTSLCSPSRAALLTGRNHHSVGFAAIAEIATGYPGSNAYLPKSAVTFAEVLKQHGVATRAIGKWHLTPSVQSTAAGPFERWPLGQGFERFYGFMPGETDHWHPMLTTDNHRIPTPEHTDYHLSSDLADQTIRMLRDINQNSTDRRFFTYLALGAPHAPFHAPAEYMLKYRDRFNDGWDIERQRTFDRQKALGIIPQNSVLPDRNPSVPAWDTLSDDAKRLYCRLQEAFCAFVDHADTQLGRVFDELKKFDQFDNTLTMVLSDNGASREGMAHGTTNTERFRNMLPMCVAEMLPDLEKIGGPDADAHYPEGWAMAGNTPFKRWKRDTHRGGNTDPLIIHWPARIKDVGSIRSQYHHIVDLYPTVLEAMGIIQPHIVNGIEQKPLEGTSLLYSLTQAAAPSPKKIQYYEMLGSRALWQDGWMAVTFHTPNTDWRQDVWELYHQDIDYTQSNNLATKYPEKLQELLDLWWAEAEKYQVLPLDDRLYTRRLGPGAEPQGLAKNNYVYWPDTAPVPMFSAPQTVGKRHRTTVHLTTFSSEDKGVLVSIGGNLGGWAFYLKDGRAHYTHNNLKITYHTVSSKLLTSATKTLAFEFVPTAVGQGTIQLYVNDEAQLMAPEQIHTAPNTYSMVQEGLQIGRQWGHSVDHTEYHGSFAFTGSLERVELYFPE